MNNRDTNRWRLVLGKFAEGNIGFSNAANYVKMDDLLEYLYGREYEERGVRRGTLDPSSLAIPEWITKIRALFPKETVEILEKHGLEKYNLRELLTDKNVLEKLEPNKELLKTILQMKHLMKGDVLTEARRIVKKVVEDITRSLEREIRIAIMGRIDKNKTGGIKSSRNIDFKRTIKFNLKNYDLENKRLIVEKMYFNRRIRYYNPWKVIIAVDESGSMIDSVIHSAIMAGIFSRLPVLKTNLVIFDTNVVDLTGYIDDPVEALMSIQLGGGTDIGKALGYCEGLIENPHRTMVILVTDLCEGARRDIMFSRAKDIIEAGAKLIILTALNMEGTSICDKNAAKTMAVLGADVAAITPGGLAKWIAEIIS